MPRSNQQHRKEARRERAEARQEARNKLNDGDQYVALRKRGHGHCEEAEYLGGRKRAF